MTAEAPTKSLARNRQSGQGRVPPVCGLMLAMALAIALDGSWCSANAHPDHPTEPSSYQYNRLRVATSGLLPPVIESQREPNDHGEPSPSTTSASKPGSKSRASQLKAQPNHSMQATGKPAHNTGGTAMLGISTQALTLQSPAFAANQHIPQRYSCDGFNVSPPLSIGNVPEKAQSLALIVDDPDAPHGTFTHWLLWNIPPNTSVIDEGHPPTSAVEGLNDFGKIGYGGPCPPSGTHRYRFRLYALDSDLNLPQGAKVKELERALRPHVLSEGMLVGTYHRH